MGMNVAPSGGGDEGGLNPVAEINVTPLVDVMLVLLIIFMVTAPLMMSQLPITLPKDSTTNDTPPKPLMVSMDINGQYSIDNGDQHELVTYDQLPVRLRAIAESRADDVILVQADKAIEYGKVVDLLSLVGGAGFNKVSIMQQAPSS